MKVHIQQIVILAPHQIYIFIVSIDLMIFSPQKFAEQFFVFCFLFFLNLNKP